MYLYSVTTAHSRILQVQLRRLGITMHSIGRYAISDMYELRPSNSACAACTMHCVRVHLQGQLSSLLVLEEPQQ